MKQFWIPFTIALLVHVLLLRLQGDWGQKRFFQAQQAPIALALTYVKPKALPVPSLPPPQTEKKPSAQDPKDMQPPAQPKKILPERPSAPKPHVDKRKSPKARKPRKELASKAIPVPTPRPEPSLEQALEDEKPQLPPTPPPATGQRDEPEATAPGPARPQQTLAAPSPSHPDSASDGNGQLAAITPEKGLKEAIPIYRRNPAPGYPRIARRKGYEGTVVLEVLVGREGRVKDLRLFQSCGHAVLDEAAEDSVRSWLFDPGKIEDKPIEMWVRVPIRFQLKE